MSKSGQYYQSEMEKRDALIQELASALGDLNAALDNEGNPPPYTTLNNRAREVLAGVAV